MSTVLSAQTIALQAAALQAADVEAASSAAVADDTKNLTDAQAAVLALQTKLQGDQAAEVQSEQVASSAAVAFFQSAAADLLVTLPLTIPAPAAPVVPVVPPAA